jgi:membrane protein DedA with SNARE-associated domain
MDIEQVQQLVKMYGPYAVGAGSMLDNTGVPIFFVVGMGTAHALGISSKLLLVSAVLGSIVGDLGTYAIGRYFLTKDRILISGIGDYIRPLLEIGEKAMCRWGGICTLIFGRFIPYAGKVTPLLAGSYQMSWLRAVLSVCVGSVMLMGLFHVYAQNVFEVISGNITLIRILSISIGTAVLLALYCVNRALKKG